MAGSPRPGRCCATAGFVLACLCLTQLGCATYVAFSMDGPTNDEDVEIGMHRSEVESIVRQSAVSQFPVHDQTEARYTYSDGPPAWSKIRALLYVGADVLTLFLSELIFWPIELYSDNQIERNATARFDKNLVLQKWTVRREANNEVLYAVSGEPARPVEVAQVASPSPSSGALASTLAPSAAPSASPPGPMSVSSAGGGAGPMPSLYATRRGRREQEPPAVGGIDFGRYHALVIGNDDYANLPPLRTATADANAMAELLAVDYGFDVELMLNGTRSQIVSSLYRYRQELGKSDNLLIYYAGHGWLDDATGRGYWLPVDATTEDPANWVSNATITDLLKGNPAKHILVVADTCYSGTLTRGIKIQQRSDANLETLSTKRARTVLTSGGTEPVEDGLGTHSVFARAVMDVLSKNPGVLDAQTLFGEIRRPVMLGAHQTPEYGDIRLAGHEGGEFLFVRPSE